MSSMSCFMTRGVVRTEKPQCLTIESVIGWHHSASGAAIPNTPTFIPTPTCQCQAPVCAPLCLPGCLPGCPSVSLRRRLAVALHRPLARTASRLALFAAHAENRAAPQRQVPDDVIGHVTGRLRAITTTTTTTQRHWSTSRCPSF